MSTAFGRRRPTNPCRRVFLGFGMCLLLGATSETSPTISETIDYINDKTSTCKRVPRVEFDGGRLHFFHHTWHGFYWDPEYRGIQVNPHHVSVDPSDPDDYVYESDVTGIAEYDSFYSELSVSCATSGSKCITVHKDGALSVWQEAAMLRAYNEISSALREYHSDTRDFDRVNHTSRPLRDKSTAIGSYDFPVCHDASRLERALKHLITSLGAGPAEELF